MNLVDDDALEFTMQCPNMQMLHLYVETNPIDHYVDFGEHESYVPHISDSGFNNLSNTSTSGAFNEPRAYVAYIFQPWVQRRRLAYPKRKHVIFGILKHFKDKGITLLADDGRPDEEVVKILFHDVDENKDGFLSHSELRALIIGIQIDEINLEENDAIERVIKDFDTTIDSRVSVNEFTAGVGRWIEEANRARIGILASPNTMMSRDHHHEQTRRENNIDEDVELVKNPRWITLKAILLLLLGTATAAAFANPLVDAVNNFSNATKIPTFFISVIALPLATNSSEAVSAIIFASRKKLRSTSLTFSELYGAISINNMMCLSVFLALVYVRCLAWNFTSEVLVILVVCIVMGLFASTRTTFPLWTCFLAFSLYPFSLALVYVLDYVFHCS
ncbi:sodium/calcium exchanger NCL-like [Primulina huaijiensis]|uniref:sodium/calcium exchanger NCL-like n=1 Tax=Primulina huaijiensis TaxID=1492673 RepID=UPI003CC7107E